MEHQPSPQRRQVSLSTFIIVILIVLLVGFVVGTRSSGLISTVNRTFGTTIDNGQQLDTSSAQQVYRTLLDHFEGEIDPAVLEEGAARGVAEATGDPYTVFLNAEEAAQFKDDLSGSLSGIGAEIGVRSDQPTVLRLIENSPAEKSGLKAGDVITKVDDTITDGFTAFEAAEIIRGEAGTDVKITVMRGDKTPSFTITRAQVSDTSVSSELRGKTGVIKIRRFDSDTGDLARRAARGLIAQGATSVVLDLRDNGGGYLNQAQSVAGIWLNNKLVVTDRRGGVEVEKLMSTGERIFESTPTIVLINGGSASASEVVAGALHDHGVATLLGEQSFGKGTVQKVFNLSGGSQLKVTIAHWLTPNGVNLAEAGIEPDTEVKLTADDLNESQDPQLEAALKKLR